MKSPDRKLASSGSPYEPRIGFSRAVRQDNLIFVSGTAPIWPDDYCDPDPGAQARRCFDVVIHALAELGARPSDVVRTRVFITSAEFADAVGKVHGEIFADIRPASTMVVVAGFLDPRWKVEVEADAVLGGN